jgi:hypothetical protein
MGSNHINRKPEKLINNPEMFVVHELSSQTNFPRSAGRYANTVSKMIRAAPAPSDFHAFFIMP